MIRRGALIHFRKGVTTAEAAAALEKIRAVLDLPAEVVAYTDDEEAAGRFRTAKATRRPFEMRDAVREYDDAMGGPTWYIP